MPSTPLDHVVVHIPHSSTFVPADVSAAFVLDDKALAVELIRMTDAHTDRLFGDLAGQGATQVVHRVSRMVVDPERFEDDAAEPMAARGMGVVYETTSHGERLRDPPTPEERTRLLDRFYRPHHAALAAAVDGALVRTGRCLLIDGHSFPSVPLPYEPDQAPERPDICLGTDAFHTPRELLDAATAEVGRLGWTIAVDRPFAGTIVPMTHYRRDARVASLMIEVNRRLYMDETSGVPTPALDDVRERLHDLMRVAAAVFAP